MKIIAVILLASVCSACTAPKSSYQRWHENAPRDWSHIKTVQDQKAHDEWLERGKCRINYTLMCMAKGY